MTTLVDVCSKIGEKQEKMRNPFHVEYSNICFALT